MIELMVVVAVLGVLASIALPKYSNLVLKSKESAVKGQLGALRSAVSLYYAGTEGLLPASAATLPTALTTSGKYLTFIPPLQVPPPGNHAHTTLVTGTMADDGRWFYVSAQGGRVAVSCQVHRTVDGTIWSRW